MSFEVMREFMYSLNNITSSRLICEDLSSAVTARRPAAAERFIVRCDTPPHAAAWNEHQAVPTVARESKTNARGSKRACFVLRLSAGGVSVFSAAGFTESSL